MKNWPKNSLTIILMVSSIVLLLILQAFWLRSAYRDAVDNFRRETNALFRTTVFAQHDSVIQRGIEPLERDSLRHTFRHRHFGRADSVSLSFEPPPFDDSVISYIRVREKTARIEIFSSSGRKDSLGRVLRPLITKMKMGKEPKNFVLRLDVDSLNVDSLTLSYQRALSKAGIDAHFQVVALRGERGTHRQQRDSRMERTGIPGQRFTTDVVWLNPGNRYAVSFTGIEGLMLAVITPQMLFSLFVTMITLASFYIMYRNIRSQQRLMQIKNDFISNVTHELKTPVATVSVALEALKNFHALDNPQRTSEYLEIAQNELDRLTLMTDKILKTAVYEDHGVALKVETTDLDALLQDVLSSMKLVFEKHKTHIAYQKEGVDFTLAGSQAHLTNVLYNLLDNALKYSGDGATVDIALRNNGHELILSIKDNGIGIAAEYQKKIFEKFFRVPSGDVHNTKGYGLGLSYVASVVKNHGGSISVASEPEKGSCFVIVLPRQQNLKGGVPTLAE